MSFPADGQPFSIDLLLEFLEEMAIDFDEAGNSSRLALVAHPKLRPSIVKVMSQAEIDPRYQELMERKKEEWRVRENNRKLLDKASERSFQLPYCYMLSAEGHTIIHLTRHCGMEMGKDIITIDRMGTPCAFQLKAGNISLNKWQKDVGPQIDDLVVGKINHQSVDSQSIINPTSSRMGIS